MKVKRVRVNEDETREKDKEIRNEGKEIRTNMGINRLRYFFI